MKKTKRKACRFTAICLLMICLLTVAFMKTAFAAGSTIDVTLPVEQTFNSIGTDRTDLSGEFAYEITAKNSGDPLPVGASGDKYSFKIDGTDKKELKMQYIHAGEYIYTIKQVVGDEVKGYTYDDEVYTLKVYIRNLSDDGLSSEVIVQMADNNKTAAVAFVNEYKPKASNKDLMVDPPVRKVVKGSPTTQSQFEFKLTAEKPDNPMPEDSVNGVKTVTINGSGTKEFGVWSYEAAGTYNYTVSETNTGVTGYTYDTTVYAIKDVVTDKDGALKLTRTVTNSAGQDAQTCIFTNIYLKNGSGSGSGSGPKTGDEDDNTWWIVLLCVGAAAALGCIIYLIVKRSKRKC